MVAKLSYLGIVTAQMDREEAVLEMSNGRQDQRVGKIVVCDDYQGVVS